MVGCAICHLPVRRVIWAGILYCVAVVVVLEPRAVSLWLSCLNLVLSLWLFLIRVSSVTLRFAVDAFLFTAVHNSLLM